MNANPVRFIVPFLLGTIIWVLAFFIVGYTQMPGGPEELYLPMVFVSFVIWTALAYFVFRWYCKHYEIKTEWPGESLLFGLIITILQFVYDILSFIGFLGYTPMTFVTDYLLKSTVLIMYPLITVELVLIGYLLNRFDKL